MRWTASIVWVGAAVVAAALSGPVRAEVPEFSPKVTDVAVFKDGHALVMTRGEATLEDGWCRTREVPVPMLGTFWGFVADDKARVDIVRAGFADDKETRPCLTLDEMIEANVGKQVTLVEQVGDNDPVDHEGTLLGILKHEAEDERTVSNRTPDRYDSRGRYISGRNVTETRVGKAEMLASFVMVQTHSGVDLVQRGNVRSISIRDKEPGKVCERKKEVREITMHVAGMDGKVGVGMVYVQRGIRWIPNYRVELLDGGKARLTLQATIINDIIDLENVHLRMVVGVPSFIMQDNMSPVALRESPLQLSSYFMPPDRSGDSQMAFLANSMMSQRAMQVREAPAGGGGPDIPGEGQMEDLYLYEQTDFSLKKDGRAVITLLEVTVPYEDVYAWDVPPFPPREMWHNMNQDQLRQMAASLTGAKAMHKLRLKNSGKTPWTTGPATIFKQGAILGQQLMTYTSINNEVDLPVTIATDLNTKKEELETGREPNALRIHDHSYTKIFFRGKLTVTNFKDYDVKVTVTRFAMGTITTASDDGKVVQVNALESAELMGSGGPGSWYDWSWRWWPDWWWRANSVSRATWELTLPKGKSATVEYDWHYYQY